MPSSSAPWGVAEALDCDLQYALGPRRSLWDSTTAYQQGRLLMDGEELEGLRRTHLVNRSQLNEWEQQNIEAALLWLLR
jgi:hypothetical protein